MGQASRPGSYGGLRVLIAGGGVAGLEAMLALNELAGDLVDVELLAPDLHFWYRPLSVAEPFGRSQAYHFELPVVAGDVGASFTPGALTAVEPGRHVAHTSRGAELAYDVLVVACGARATPALEGALTFRGPSDTERFQALLAELEGGAVRRLVFACPASAGWSLPLYELALLTAAHLEEREIAGVELTLVTPEPAALARLGAGASEAVELLLAEHDVTLVPDSRPVSFAARYLRARRRSGGQGRPGRRASPAPGPTGHRSSARPRRLRCHRCRRPRRGTPRRLRGRRHHQVPGQAGWDRRPAGGCRCRDDRRARRRGRRAVGVRARDPRAAALGRRAAVHPCGARGGRPAVHRLDRAALVAAVEGRRPVSVAVPRLAGQRGVERVRQPARALTASLLVHADPVEPGRRQVEAGRGEERAGPSRAQPDESSMRAASSAAHRRSGQ